MVNEQDVLTFFRNELPVLGTFTGKLIPLQLDDILQDYTEDDDLAFVWINSVFSSMLISRG